MGELTKLVRSANSEVLRADIALTELSLSLPVGPGDAALNATEAGLARARKLVWRINDLLSSTLEHAPDGELSGEASEILKDHVGLKESLKLGSARVLIFDERLSISWGYVDRIYTAPLVTEADAPLLRLALISLDKSHGGNGLIRENHHSGYHYHYVDAGRRRSDVLFTFGSAPPEPANPVTWERHGEGHARFSPKVDGWGFSKRESVNKVCCANAKKLGPGSFMTPSKEAEYLLPM